MPKIENTQVGSMHISTPYFRELEIPVGFLSRDPACHALWYYCCLIRNQMNERDETIRYEGDWPVDPEANAKNIFKTVAFLYGIAPERMLKFWVNIDMQMAQLGANKMPHWARFDKVPDVRTQ